MSEDQKSKPLQIAAITSNILMYPPPGVTSISIGGTEFEFDPTVPDQAVEVPEFLVADLLPHGFKPVPQGSNPAPVPTLTADEEEALAAYRAQRDAKASGDDGKDDGKDDDKDDGKGRRRGRL